MMDSPTSEHPDREPHTPPPTTPSNPVDRVTAALGNAVLPGLGYAFAWRWWAATAALAGALLLFVLLLRTGLLGYQVLLVLWWGMGIVHGALLRDAPARRPERKSRHVTLGLMALTVLILASSLRHQGATVAADVEAARSEGDCVAVRTAQGSLAFFVRAANAPLAAESEQTVEACDRLDEATELLAQGLKGDTAAAKDGFAALDAARPGDGALARSALDSFLRSLDSQKPCVLAAATGWLRDHDKKSALRDRASDVAGRKAPAALSACGDARMESREWAKAKKSFQKLIADHPSSPLTDHARKETTRAKHETQLETVERKLESSTYCKDPTPYGAAKAYGKGSNQALFTAGEDEEYIKDLPDKWRTSFPGDATMVVCTHKPSEGDAVATCPYVAEDDASLTFNVRWTKVKIGVKVYELRTGKLVADRSVQISGKSCPAKYPYFLTPLRGSTLSESVEPSASDVRKAFAPLLKR